MQRETFKCLCKLNSGCFWGGITSRASNWDELKPKWGGRTTSFSPLGQSLLSFFKQLYQGVLHKIEALSNETSVRNQLKRSSEVVIT